MAVGDLSVLLSTSPSRGGLGLLFPAFNPVPDRRGNLKKERLSNYTSGKDSTIFRNELVGIQFVGAYHKNKGKVIRIHNPSKVHQDFVRHTDSLLSSPPKNDLTRRSLPERGRRFNRLT